jgi:sigma-B regulation protein RsbU (phosphoserine phosphatase)
LLHAIALLVALELENVRLRRSEFEKQRLLKELELARTIQQSLLPRNFSGTSFLEAAGISEPCCEIGGDFFDLIPISAGLSMLIIADVSGKGPPAALQAAMVQGIVNAVSRTCPDLPSLMSTLNECLLTRSAVDRFVTAFAATLSSDGRLHYSNGGHTSTVWIQQNGDVIELTQGGPLLGSFPSASYTQGSIQMTPGDLLVMYTDGVTEAHDGKGGSFGTDRLLNWARHQRGRLPDEVKNSLIAAVGDFCGDRRQDDDRSVLVVRYTGPNTKCENERGVILA